MKNTRIVSSLIVTIFISAALFCSIQIAFAASVGGGSNPGGQIIGQGTINGQSYTVYQPNVQQGPHLSLNPAVVGSGAPNNDDDDDPPVCGTRSYIPDLAMIDIYFISRGGAVVGNTALKTNVPYRPVAVVDNNSCLATNDVMRFDNDWQTGTAFVRFSGTSGNNQPRAGEGNTFYKNDPPEGQHGSVPVRAVIDMVPMGVPTIRTQVNQVGPFGRFSGSNRYNYNRLVQPQYITTARVVLPQKSLNQLAVDEGGSIVSGSRAIVYFPEITFAGTGQGNFRINADPETIPGGLLYEANKYGNIRDENITVGAASLSLGSLLIINGGASGYGQSNTATPRGLKQGEQIGIWWSGQGIDFAGCTGRMTRTGGTALNDFNGRRDTTNFSNNRLALLPSNTSRDRIDLNITEPNPGQTHTYTLTCPVLGGGQISDSLQIAMSSSPNLGVVMRDVYVYPGEVVSQIPFDVTNRNPTTVTNFRYDLLINNRPYRSSTINNTSIEANRTGSYLAASSTYKAPFTIGAYPMALNVFISGSPTAVSDTATLNVVGPRYRVNVPDVRMVAGAPIPRVNFTITNTDTTAVADDIPGFRFEIDMGTADYRNESRWTTIVPQSTTIDVVSARSGVTAPSTARTYTDHIEVCVYTVGIVTPICGYGDLITSAVAVFPLSPVVNNITVEQGDTLTAIPFSVNNSTASDIVGFNYTARANNSVFGSASRPGDRVRANGSLNLTAAGNYRASALGTFPIEVCLTRTGIPGTACDRADLRVIPDDVTNDPQCDDKDDNDGDGLTDYPNDPGCIDADDDDETNGGGSITGTTLRLTANPPIVRYQTRTDLAYEVRSLVALTCEISGGGVNKEFAYTPSPQPLRSTLPTNQLGGTQLFTLTCTAPNGTTASETVSVEVVPESQEI